MQRPTTGMSCLARNKAYILVTQLSRVDLKMASWLQARFHKHTVWNNFSGCEWRLASPQGYDKTFQSEDTAKYCQTDLATFPKWWSPAKSMWQETIDIYVPLLVSHVSHKWTQYHFNYFQLSCLVSNKWQQTTVIRISIWSRCWANDQFFVRHGKLQLS